LPLLSERTPPAPIFPAIAFVLMLLPLGGCFDVSAPATPTATGYEAELALCVSITNSFRASESRAALARAARLETYAAEPRGTMARCGQRMST
jgi:hypothetical protein